MMESGAMLPSSRIVFTGPPGIGKTTLCEKIISMILENNFKCNGFYTEEVRSKDHRRIGFDIVTLSKPEKRCPLARNDSALDGKHSKIRVGSYQVFIKDFEEIALPTLSSTSDILIIDEIGKMELFSKIFYETVENIFFGGNSNIHKVIIATIPSKERIPQRYSKLFEKFYNNSNCRVIEVNRLNRDKLPEEIFHEIRDIVKENSF